MAYDTNWKLKTEFEELVGSWLASSAQRARLTHNDWQQMHWALDGLRYLATVKREYPKIEDRAPVPGHVKCMGCDRTSAEPDACVINFSGPGTRTPEWYCRDHYPKRDGLMPAGWTLPAAEQARCALATKMAWHKLSPEERPLINRNIVTVASSGE